MDTACFMWHVINMIKTKNLISFYANIEILTDIHCYIIITCNLPNNVIRIFEFEIILQDYKYTKCRPVTQNPHKAIVGWNCHNSVNSEIFNSSR